MHIISCIDRIIDKHLYIIKPKYRYYEFKILSNILKINKFLSSINKRNILFQQWKHFVS